MEWITKNRRAWIRGLVAAIVGGAANAVTVMIVEPQHFNLHEGLGKLGTVTLVAAIVGAALYLKEHPIWDEDEEPVTR